MRVQIFASKLPYVTFIAAAAAACFPAYEAKSATLSFQLVLFASSLRFNIAQDRLSGLVLDEKAGDRNWRGGDAAADPWMNELSNRQLEVLDVASIDRLKVDISDGSQIVGAVLQSSGSRRSVPSVPLGSPPRSLCRIGAPSAAP